MLEALVQCFVAFSPLLTLISIASSDKVIRQLQSGNDRRICTESG